MEANVVSFVCLPLPFFTAKVQAQAFSKIDRKPWGGFTDFDDCMKLSPPDRCVFDYEHCCEYECERPKIRT